jgi:hypothetical protein
MSLLRSSAGIMAAVTFLSAPLRSQVTVNSMTSAFTSPIPSGNVVSSTAGTTASITWGVPASANGSSGFNFATRATPFNVSTPGEFRLGTLTHINQPINSGTGLSQVDLSTTLGLTGATPASFTELFRLFIDETPNNCTPLPSCANDVITFGATPSSGMSFMIGADTYFLNLLGFRANVDGDLLPSFSSAEGSSNSADLWAEISTASTVTPEPASLVLLITGMVGVFGVTRRKQRV